MGISLGQYIRVVVMTYFEVTLGIIFPHVRVSTSKIKGIIDKTLWWDEKGVSQ